MKRFRFWRRQHGPSTEAIAARGEAAKIRVRADAVYTERRKILDDNHFAERIRLIYEGR